MNAADFFFLMSKRFVVLAAVLVASKVFAQSSVPNLKAPTAVESEILRTALQYFTDNANPESGIVLDSASNFEANLSSNTVGSIAATGFGLAVRANAAMQGQQDLGATRDYVLKTLIFCRDHVSRFHGWFLHWMDWQTGERVWQSEYSTIDTALFMAGALYAAKVLGDSEISMIVDKLYSEMDFFTFLTDDGSKPNKKTLSLSYKPESGFAHSQWEIYAEQMILLFLGIGHPIKPIPAETWFAWRRQASTVNPFLMAADMPLFIHQYSHLFLDFRQFNDGYGNYFENSVRVTKLHRSFVGANAKFKTLKAGFWGFSAGIDPEGYKVWTPLLYSGTVCVGCVVGSAMFTKDLILSDVQLWLQSPYKNLLWGRYGFIDSLDLDRNWFAKNVIGITKGPEYLSFANTNTENSIWKEFMQLPSTSRAIKSIQMHLKHKK